MVLLDVVGVPLLLSELFVNRNYVFSRKLIGLIGMKLGRGVRSSQRESNGSYIFSVPPTREKSLSTISVSSISV